MTSFIPFSCILRLHSYEGALFCCGEFYIRIREGMTLGKEYGTLSLLIDSIFQRERVYIVMNEFKGTNEYVVSEELLRSVNIAIALGKPLLIKGEPGTGKTMLADAISRALEKKLYIWNVKSSTKAQDGLYVYDTVQRLYDSQFGEQGVDNIAQYIKLGKLGEAFQLC